MFNAKNLFCFHFGFRCYKMFSNPSLKLNRYQSGIWKTSESITNLILDTETQLLDYSKPMNQISTHRHSENNMYSWNFLTKLWENIPNPPSLIIPNTWFLLFFYLTSQQRETPTVAASLKPAQRWDPAKSPDLVGGEQLHSETLRQNGVFHAVLKWLPLSVQYEAPKSFTPAVLMHSFWTLRPRGEGRTGVRNYLLDQRTPASTGREDNSPSFPCWSDAIKGRSGAVSITPTEEERREWAMRRRKQEGWEGKKSALQHHANPEKTHLQGELACRTQN